MGNDYTKISNFNIEIKDLSGAKFSKKVTINGHTFRLMSKKSLSLINQVDNALKNASSLINDNPEQFLNHNFNEDFEPILKKGFFEKIFGIVPKYKKELRSKANKILQQQQQQLIKYQKLEQGAYKEIENGKYTTDLKSFLNSDPVQTKLKKYKKSFQKILRSKGDACSEKEIAKLFNLKTELSESILKQLATLEKKENPEYGSDVTLPVMELITLSALGTDLSYNFLPQYRKKLNKSSKQLETLQAKANDYRAMELEGQKQFIGTLIDLLTSYFRQ